MDIKEITKGLNKYNTALVESAEKLGESSQKMIAKLGVEEARVANSKKKAETEVKQPVRTQTLDQAIAPQAKTDPKAEEWADKNPWFGHR